MDDMIYWDHYYNAILLLNLIITIALFTSLRLFSGVIAHIDPSNELLKKDNPAFGISLAGATFAIAIILSSTIYGNSEANMLHAAMAVGLYGLLGIGLMALTRFIFDKVTLSTVSLRDEIVRGNIAVAIADAGNVLAAAIIIRAVMLWVTVDTLEGVIALLGGYAVSQFLLTAMNFLRMKALGASGKGCLQDELKSGNTALALRFAGQKIGTAFAIATAAQIVVYEEYGIVSILGAWFVASIAVIIVWKALAWIATKIILFGTDVNQEVIDRKNIAIGALQAAIYAALGFLISQL
jgi:uncharacterized membrane protein YjfL (UPF0719 family)